MWRTLTTKLAAWFRPRRGREIDPDEVLLDATNLPEFDVYQFEGRLERPIGMQTFVIFAAVALFVGVVFTARAFELQVVDGATYRSASQQNHLREALIFGGRGIIEDRYGTELAWNTAGGERGFPLREYTDTPGLAHVLGYVSYPARDRAGFYYRDDYVGNSGAEAAFDEMLDGTHGRRIVEMNALGDVQFENIIARPTEGETVTLSIDAPLQSALFSAIQETAESVSFEGGTAAVMDIHTGELFALTSFPEYDPDVLSSGESGTEIARYVQDPHTPFLNRAASGLYTPGSIVKPFIALAALEEGIIEPETEILSTGSIEIPNPYFPNRDSVFTDWKAHGRVDMVDALAVSSNVYFYTIGGGLPAEAAAQAGVESRPGLGIETLAHYMRLFGMSEETGVALGGESAGTIPTPAWKADAFNGEPWRLGDTYNTAIGQYGFQVTPLQMVRAVGALAGDGTLFKPALRAGADTQKRTLTLDENNMDIVRAGMRAAVERGTASGLNVASVNVAAKTGTAEIGSRKKLVNSWAVGFFPYEQPRFAFVVLMERGPADNLIGGVYVARQMFDWMAQHRPEYLTSD